MDNKTKFLLLILASVIVLAGCRADPRKEAAAYATRSQADQQAASAQQQRLIEKQLHDAKMEQLKLEQQVKEANKQNMIRVRTMFLWTFGIFGCILVATVMIYTSKSYAVASVGVAEAVVQGAMVRANTIRLDPRTRQFPLLLQHVHGTQWALINPNVGSVTMLDTAHEPDRQMISTAGATQIAGVLASEAGDSKDAAGVAMINPPIVHAQTEEIVLGSEYLQSGKE